MYYNAQSAFTETELLTLKQAAGTKCEPPPNVFRTRAELDAAWNAGKVAPQRHLDLTKLFDEQEMEHIQNNYESDRAKSGKAWVDGFLEQCCERDVKSNTAHSPALQTLSKMVAEGKCDGIDILAKLKAGTTPEFLAANEGRDMGEAVVAAMDAEQKHIHKPAPKIETREQAAAAIKQFEANKSDMGDQVVALELRKQFGIWEVL